MNSVLPVCYWGQTAGVRGIPQKYVGYLHRKWWIYISSHYWHRIVQLTHPSSPCMTETLSLEKGSWIISQRPRPRSTPLIWVWPFSGKFTRTNRCGSRGQGQGNSKRIPSSQHLQARPEAMWPQVTMGSKPASTTPVVMLGHLLSLCSAFLPCSPLSWLFPQTFPAFSLYPLSFQKDQFSQGCSPVTREALSLGSWRQAFPGKCF